jgi:Holliday junction resolvasome RuvABC DNA-binding subunit
MTTLTKISKMRAINAEKVMASSAAYGKDIGAQSRLSKVMAASNDPTKKAAFDHAVKALSRLGFAIDQVAATGSTAQLDEAMKKLKWSTNERIALKANLGHIGALGA